jgi:hypothetical protein
MGNGAEVGLIAAGSALAGTALAQVGTLWAASKQRTHDRSMREEDRKADTQRVEAEHRHQRDLRLWDDRRTAYVTALRSLYVERRYLTEMMQAVETLGELPTWPGDEEDWTRLLAEAMPFLSEPVLAAVRAAEGVRVETVDQVTEFVSKNPAADPETEILPILRAGRKRLGESIEVARLLIAEEISSGLKSVMRNG